MALSKRFRRLYLALLLNFALFGVTLTILGATVPQIIRAFDWSYTATGFVLAAGSVGYFISTFLCGFLMQRVGPKPVVVVGLGLEALSLSFFARHPSPLLNLMLNFLLGFGQGGTEVVTNFAVIRMERPGESRLMNLMHAMFCVGAILGPIGLGSLLRVSTAWRTIYRFAAFLCLAMAGVFAGFSFDFGQESTRQRHRNARVLREPLLILLFLIILIYVGAELGVSSWIAEYYVKVLHASPSFGAYMVSIFWMGLLTGRLLLSAYYGNRRQEPLLVMLASLCALFLFLAIGINQPVGTAIFVFFTGLGYSGIYPVVMAVIGHHFKQGQEIAVGFVSTGGGIGAFLFPFPIALLAERFGLRGAFLFCALMNVILLALTIAVAWQTRQSPQPSD